MQVHRMGIEVTLRCNLRCRQCDHHCDLPDQLPYVADSDMTLDQIGHFIEEVKQKDVRIVRLTVTGGESLLHPQIVEIVRMLRTELVDTGHIVRRRIRVVSNGLIAPTRLLSKLCHIKTLVPVGDRRNRHMASWQAPIDTGQKLGRWGRGANHCGCNIPFRCGFVLCRYGYYPCGPGGAIIRLMGIDGWVRQEFPIVPWDLPRLREEVCIYCQYAGRNPCWLPVDKHPEPSPSYKAAFGRRSWELPVYGGE